MGCLGRGALVGVILLQCVAFILTMLVLGSAGVLGEAALIAADDAVLLVVLSALGLLGTLVLSMTCWRGARSRRRLERELLMARDRPGMTPWGTTGL